MFLSKVRVTLRASILDPQGKAVQHAIESLSVAPVTQVRIGKYIELTVDEASEEAARRATEVVCQRLLANPVMEDYAIEVTRL